MTLVEEGRLTFDFPPKLEQDKSLDLEKGIHDDDDNVDVDDNDNNFDVDNITNHKEEQEDDEREFDSNMINTIMKSPPTRQSFFYFPPKVVTTYQEKETFALKNSVYSLIIIAPVFSWAFLVSMYWILLKYVLFGMLLPSTDEEGTFKVPHNRPLLIAKFLLIPVSVTYTSIVSFLFFFFF
jgi:hypothetical protein